MYTYYSSCTSGTSGLDSGQASPQQHHQRREADTEPRAGTARRWFASARGVAGRRSSREGAQYNVS